MIVPSIQTTCSRLIPNVNIDAFSALEYDPRTKWWNYEGVV